MAGKNPAGEREANQFDRNHEPSRRAHGLVEYRSSALEATAPELSSADEARRIAQAPPIIACHRVAEQVREQFKRRKGGSNGRRSLDNGTQGAGNEETDKARRYDRRQEMNRNSAAASRVRREAYTKALERELVKMYYDSLELQNKLKAVEKENAGLDSQIKPENYLTNAALFTNFAQSLPAPAQTFNFESSHLIPDPTTTNVQGAVSLDVQQQQLSLGELPDLPPLTNLEQELDDALFSRNSSADPSV